MDTQENRLYLNKHILLHIENELSNHNSDEITYLKKNFCGKVINDIEEINQVNDDNVLIYIFGDIVNILDRISNKPSNKLCNKLYVIKELSYNYDTIRKIPINIIGLGEVPININNVGVFFRDFFSSNSLNSSNYFDLLTKEHQFQVLTESNKPGESYRKGIYITNVKENNEGIAFNLLRCSTNLDGPTDNFRQTDTEIIEKVNNISRYFFDQYIDFNHVLAQVYNNVKIENKERKAKISAHSDKTKDMPPHALMAFCTFYNFDNANTDDIKRSKEDKYDWHYKQASVLTKLRFRLKNKTKYPDLVKEFNVILYPGSVFVMSLSTNRLYTHEISPAHLPIDKLPTRLGYVIRCSKTKAIFKNNQTYIVNNNNELTKLEEQTSEKVKHLKDLYFKENTSDELINYGLIDFSLNKGDYMKPLL